MTRTKNKSTKRATTPPSSSASAKAPFIEHLYELRKRLFFVAVAIIAGGTVAYFAQKQLIAILLQPAGNQQEFIFTSPGGGFNFVLNLCLYVGIIVAIPVIIYQLLRYLQPLINRSAMRFIWWGSFVSGILAVGGVIFGYYLGLPASMHFLLYEFANTTRVEALIAIQSYLSFVMLYLLGSALLFQVPLIMILINRIKPLSTRGLMKFQRWFTVIAFVLGAVISPSPNIQDQLMLSVPMILMYQLGIIIVWVMNRKHRKYRKVNALLQHDEAMRQERMAHFQRAQDAWLTSLHAANGGTTRQAPTVRTWQEPTQITITNLTPQPEPIRTTRFDQPAERRSYQTIPVHAE